MEKLKNKYENDIHANEIVLLACYIAGINIESVYSDLIKDEIYSPFNGLVLTDSFQLYEQEKDMIANLLPDNSQRRTNQKNKEVTVIIGNPPYSTGQSSADDNAQNLKYSNLDSRIESTYAQLSKSINKRPLYDNYIRAFRWASDRIKDEGVIGFVTNAGWIDRVATDGFRQSLEREFTNIYVFHLRGNQRTSGEKSRQEGGKVFGSGSRTPIAITLLVKRKDYVGKGKIFFHDIGDYLSRETKLAKIEKFKSIGNMLDEDRFEILNPDENNDWVNQSNKEFDNYFLICDRNKFNGETIFSSYSIGLTTCRDSWCYNSNKQKLESNIKKSIEFYNNNLLKDSPIVNLSLISWSRGLKKDFALKKKKSFNKDSIYQSLYRPFDNTNYVYFNRSFNEYVYKLFDYFPTANHENLLICITGVGAGKDFSCLMVNKLPNQHTVDTDLCFPLYVYQEANKELNLFSQFNEKNNKKKYAITDFYRDKLCLKYSRQDISKEQIFFFIYGLLHSVEYREKFKNNLFKEQPGYQ